MEPNFQGKIIFRFWPMIADFWAQNHLFSYLRVFLKIGSLEFFDFLHEVAKPSNLKTDGVRFSGKNYIFSVLVHNGRFLGPKPFVQLLTSFSKDWLIRNFWFFALTCESIQLNTWRSPIFREKSYFPGLAHNGGFLCPLLVGYLWVFLNIESLEFSDFLNEVAKPSNLKTDRAWFQGK